MSTIGGAMLAYAAEGWPVLPLHGIHYDPRTLEVQCTCPSRTVCSSPAKHPLWASDFRNGLTDATTDPDVIRRWISRWTHMNVGLRTGDVFDVLDIDGEDGRATFESWSGGRWDGPVVETGRGLHAYMLPTGSGNRARLGPGVDFRGQGGYVVAPPSEHINGRQYAWIGRTKRLRPAPDWLRWLMEPQQEAGL